MGEVESADCGPGVHCAGFGEFDPGFLSCLEELEEEGFFGVVRLGGVSGGGADALVFFVDEFGRGELAGAFDAPGNAGAVVEEFGEGFGKAVGEGLDHEGFVDVVFFAEFGGPFVGTVDAHDEAAEVVGGVTVLVTVPVLSLALKFPLGGVPELVIFLIEEILQISDEVMVAFILPDIALSAE